MRCDNKLECGCYYVCNCVKYTPSEAMYDVQAELSRINRIVSEFLNSNSQFVNNLQKTAYYVGSYFDGDIRQEEGYSTNDQTNYKIYRIPHKISSGEPIKFNLHLAQGNTTNSKILETVTSASSFELADKIFTAARGDNTVGWSGLVRYQGSSIPSDVDPDQFTIGFSENGRLNYYKNTISQDQLKRDNIVNSMGVYGLLVIQKEPVDQSLYGLEKNNPLKQSRVCIGQNYQSNDIYILVVGDYDSINTTSGADKGMTPREAARIMSGYCDFACTVSAGSGDYGTTFADKGELVLRPVNEVLPANYAYWYISRKPYFKNNISHEFANVTQKYGYLSWEMSKRVEGVENLSKKLQSLSSDLSLLEETVKELSNKNKEDNDLWAKYEPIILNLKDKTSSVVDTVSDLNNQIQSLQSVVTNYSQLVDKTTTDWATYKAMISDYQKQFNDLKDYITSKDIDKIAENISSLSNSIVSINSDITSILSDARSLDSKVETYNKDLNSKIDSVSDSLNEETKNRENDVSDLSSEIKTVEQNLTNEANLRDQQDTVIRDALNQEITDRKNADIGNLSYVSDLIDKETKNREDGDNTLTTSLSNTNSDLSAFHVDFNDYKSNVDTSLSSINSSIDKINDKDNSQDNRLSAIESQIQNDEKQTKDRLDSHQTLIEGNVANITSVLNQLNQEVSDRKSGDLELENKIQNLFFKPLKGDITTSYTVDNPLVIGQFSFYPLDGSKLYNLSITAKISGGTSVVQLNPMNNTGLGRNEYVCYMVENQEWKTGVVDTDIKGSVYTLTAVNDKIYEEISLYINQNGSYFGKIRTLSI